jgi:uncharacterized membrane protein
MKPVTETHTRTISKAALYRVLSVGMAISLTMVYGATLQQALTFGVIALFWGLAWFYIYDRFWLLIPWNRDDKGVDTNSRSVVKAILYRLAVISFSAFTARVIFTDSNFTALLMAGSQFMMNLLIYFTLERIWNQVKWGKIIPQNPEG